MKWKARHLFSTLTVTSFLNGTDCLILIKRNVKMETERAGEEESWTSHGVGWGQTERAHSDWTHGAFNKTLLWSSNEPAFMSLFFFRITAPCFSSSIPIYKGLDCYVITAKCCVWGGKYRVRDITGRNPAPRVSVLLYVPKLEEALGYQLFRKYTLAHYCGEDF